MGCRLQLLELFMHSLTLGIESMIYFHKNWFPLLIVLWTEWGTQLYSDFVSIYSQSKAVTGYFLGYLDFRLTFQMVNWAWEVCY